MYIPIRSHELTCLLFFVFSLQLFFWGKLAKCVFRTCWNHCIMHLYLWSLMTMYYILLLWFRHFEYYRILMVTVLHLKPTCLLHGSYDILTIRHVSCLVTINYKRQCKKKKTKILLCLIRLSSNYWSERFGNHKKIDISSKFDISSIIEIPVFTTAHAYCCRKTHFNSVINKFSICSCKNSITNYFDCFLCFCI